MLAGGKGEGKEKGVNRLTFKPSPKKRKYLAIKWMGVTSDFVPLPMQCSGVTRIFILIVPGP